MKGITNISVNIFIAALVLFMLPVPIFAQQGEGKFKNISISSYEISVHEFEKPFMKIDTKGTKRSYTKVYIINLKGNFGEPSAIPVDIFIGDYKVPEYGGTKDGIYFRIYDEKLLEDLENKQFSYGFQNQKVKTFKLRFTPNALRPFKKAEGIGVIM